MTGLRYSQQFPVEDAPSNQWVSENPLVDVTASDVSFGYRSATPHALQSTTSASRQLLTQAYPSMESWFKSRIAAVTPWRSMRRPSRAGRGNRAGRLAQYSGNWRCTDRHQWRKCYRGHILSLKDAIGTANSDSANCGFLTTTAQRKSCAPFPK